MGYVVLTLEECLPRSKSEAISTGLRRYFTGKICKNGHLELRDVKHGCMGCRRDKRRAYKKTPNGRAALIRNRKTERRKAAERAQKKRRLEKIKADPVLYDAYKEKQRQRRRRYTSTPSGKAWQRRRNLFKEEKIRLATPAWCDKSSLNQFIESCPEGHHIDHIIPLRGEFVCGLNVLENLQHLPAKENIQKSNKILPGTLEFNVCLVPPYTSL